MLIRSFITDRNVILLAIAYIFTLLLLDVSGGDIWLAGKFYALEGYQWSLQYHWLTEQVLHKGGRKLNYLCCATVLLLTFYYARQNPRDSKTTRSYIALSLSLLCSFALVAYLKAISNIACPWELQLFGGTEPYLHLFERRPSYLPYSQCFPAGHASVGYAWVALFFFFNRQAPRWRFVGLAAGLIAGLVFGITQQLRGAHFMSHDVTTLVLCLLCAKLCFMVICSPAHHFTNGQH